MSVDNQTTVQDPHGDSRHNSGSRNGRRSAQKLSQPSFHRRQHWNQTLDRQTDGHTLYTHTPTRPCYRCVCLCGMWRNQVNRDQVGTQPLIRVWESQRHTLPPSTEICRHRDTYTLGLHCMYAFVCVCVTMYAFVCVCVQPLLHTGWRPVMLVLL